MSHELDANLGFGKKSLSWYLIGFVFSLILTVLAFYCVAEKLFNHSNLYLVLTALAIAQLFVQSLCFIRLNGNAEGRWNSLPFIFVILISAILVGGSLWIMYNLDYNMMM